MNLLLVLTIACGQPPPKFKGEEYASLPAPKFAVAESLPSPVVVAPEVAPAKARTFQSGWYYSGHDCPNCHRVQTSIDNDSGPNHTHVCSTPGCNTSWYHVDAVSTRNTVKVGRRLFGR